MSSGNKIIQVKSMNSENEIITVNETGNERVAIVVGVKEYKNPIRNLRLTLNDANAMKKVLEEKGLFSISERDFFFTDDTILPTKENVENAISEVITQAKQGQVKSFVFYFSGHGFIDESTGHNYMATSDADIMDLQNTCISLDFFKQQLKRIEEKAKTMIFIDACRNDPTIPPSQMGDADRKNIWGDIGASGLKIMYSCQRSKCSYELPHDEHGVFTNFLLKGLKGEADIRPYGNGDGFVFFNELREYMEQQMSLFSASSQYKQLPRFEECETFGDFSITKI